jgi:hypothetical protein
VFSAISATASTGTTRTTGFPVDLQIGNDRTRIALGGSFFSDRLRGVSTTSTAFGAILYSSGNAAEGTTALTLGFDNTGFKDASFYSTYPMAWWNFRRAPGFMDIVAYEGDGTSSRNIQHNLATSAELIICKRMDNTSNWTVWSNNLSAGHILQLNGTDAEISVGSGWINSSTSTTFNIGNDSDVNASSGDYVAYLFATLAGISKVGTYTGTGSDKNVDCGFSAGARFILIRRIDSTGDWYVWDTARGIVSGNDPYLLLNSTAAEVTNTDYIDPLSTGFTVTASAPAALNASGGSYIFLAIA